MNSTEKQIQAKQTAGTLSAKPSLVYGSLLLVIVVSVTIAFFTPLLIPKYVSRLSGPGVVGMMTGALAFVVLFLLRDKFISAKHSKEAVKMLDVLHESEKGLRSFRNQLWASILAFVINIAASFEFSRMQQIQDKPQSNAIASSRTATSIETTPSLSRETFTVILYIPTRFRDVQIFVDGQPANVTDAELSQIKLRVPRKPGLTQFRMESDLLKTPKAFGLLIDHDNYEYSPFK